MFWLCSAGWCWEPGACPLQSPETLGSTWGEGPGVMGPSGCPLGWCLQDLFSPPPVTADMTDSACTAAGFHENRNLNFSVRANCIWNYKTPIKCPWFLQADVFLFSCTVRAECSPWQRGSRSHGAAACCRAGSQGPGEALGTRDFSRRQQQDFTLLRGCSEPALARLRVCLWW